MGYCSTHIACLGEQATRPAAAVTSGAVASVAGGRLGWHPEEGGRELWVLRQKIVASGEPLLNADEIDREVGRRRGGNESSD